MQLLERANKLQAAGHSVVHMEVGQPDLPAPEACRAAGIAAINEGQDRYTPSFGLPELQREISAYYRDLHGLEIEPRRIVATVGTSGAFLLLLGAEFSPGDRIAVTDPGYPCYPNFFEFLGLETVRIPVRPDDGYRPRPDLLEAALAEGPIQGMILTSPSNPTGATLPLDDYQEVLARVPFVISDEIYHGLWLADDPPVFTGAAVDPQRVAVIDGFSKKWSMTGSRLGWIVLPDADLDARVEHMEMLTQNLFICPPTVAQYAGIAALRDARDEVALRAQVYRERLDYLIPAIEALGFVVPSRPQGAFYLYADVSAITDDAYAFCFDLLERAHVAITPGADFGEHHAERYVRFSLATSLESIKEGVARIRRYLDARAGR